MAHAVAGPGPRQRWEEPGAVLPAGLGVEHSLHPRPGGERRPRGRFPGREQFFSGVLWGHLTWKTVMTENRGRSVSGTPEAA